MMLSRRFAAACLISSVLVWAGCRGAQAPEIRALSEQEVADLWRQAESREPVGDPLVQQIPTDTGATVITTQVFMLRRAGGGPSTQVILGCGGSCTLTPGGTFEGCKTSGCLASGDSCTPLVCSGTCTVSSPCKPLKSSGIFAQ
jgi:hypothetical protein